MNGKTFDTVDEAYQFAGRHRYAWVHKIFEGPSEAKKHIGYHVVWMGAL